MLGRLGAGRLKAPIQKLFPLIGSYTSLIALIYMLQPGKHLSILQIVLLGVGTLFFLISVHQKYAEMPIRMDSEAEIAEYMFDLIDNGGNVAICSRDMSWAEENKQIQKLLDQKSENNELTVCLPVKTEFVKGLENKGARIQEYEELDYITESRFTIVNRGRMDAKLAIGRRIDGTHTVEEVYIGDSATFHLAKDIVELISGMDN